MKAKKIPKKRQFTLSTRQQLYKKFRLEGMTKFAAAIKAGYAYTTARNCSQKVDKVCNIAEWLEINGLTDPFLAAHAKQGIEATKQQMCDIYVSKDEEGNYKVEENKSAFIEVDDWNTRHKYFETTLKLKNKINDKPIIPITIEEHTHLTLIIDKNEVAENQRDSVPSDEATRISLKTSDES